MLTCDVRLYPSVLKSSPAFLWTLFEYLRQESLQMQQRNTRYSSYFSVNNIAQSQGHKDTLRAAHKINIKFNNISYVEIHEHSCPKQI